MLLHKWKYFVSSSWYHQNIQQIIQCILLLFQSRTGVAAYPFFCCLHYLMKRTSTLFPWTARHYCLFQISCRQKQFPCDFDNWTQALYCKHPDTQIWQLKVLQPVNRRYSMTKYPRGHDGHLLTWVLYCRVCLKEFIFVCYIFLSIFFRKDDGLIC